MWALLFLVPLIILYLIRPKPKMLAIPSLMFFLRSSGMRRLNSFLRQVTHDWLFLIQLLLLLGLVLTFAHPFTKYQHDVTASNTVIVLDVSASSQVREGARSRFDLSIAQAKKVLGSKNTIILAKDVPFIALQDASAEDASKFLNGLSPKSTISRIGEAVILAGETLKEGRVVVVSDFINTGGQDPDIAKAVLESKGLVVDFINVAGSPRKNVGIVQFDVGNDQCTVYVKNYFGEQQKFNLRVGSTVVPMSVPANSIETFAFKTPAGVAMLELDVSDDFGVDNYAFLSAPAGGKAKVLLISNNESTFLKNALLASGELDVVVTEPPVISEGSFDVIVIHNVDPVQVLPGTFEDILARAENGATVIVGVQDNSDRLDYRGLLPVKISGKSDGGFVSVDQLNRFTKNIDFGAVTNLFTAEPLGEQSVIASVNGVPVISVKPVGSGKLVYFGISEDSEFKYAPHYPIFWTELMKFVTEQQDVRNLNFKAGDTLILDKEQKIKTPSKTVKRAALVLDEVGIYELEDRVIAVNLVDELESNVNLEKQVGTKSLEYELKPVKETREFPLDIWLLVFALFFILFEVFFVKYRGDV
ncbi:BatA and WFA domain-containing protein [Candidatus Woesearchaeota archaeon]|nr:BatA and WFA domain-containing protein [Candidatus Woesearchaeota archaeon]